MISEPARSFWWWVAEMIALILPAAVMGMFAYWATRSFPWAVIVFVAFRRLEQIQEKLKERNG